MDFMIDFRTLAEDTFIPWGVMERGLSNAR